MRGAFDLAFLLLLPRVVNFGGSRHFPFLAITYFTWHLAGHPALFLHARRLENKQTSFQKVGWPNYFLRVTVTVTVSRSHLIHGFRQKKKGISPISHKRE